MSFTISMMQSKRFSRPPITLLGSVLAAAALAVSCSKKQPNQDTAERTAKPAALDTGNPKEDAKKIFAGRCTVCHGTTGEGDGPGSAALNPKPRSFSDSSWQGSVDDAHLAKVILEGGPSVKLSPLMPANPDLKDKPEVVAQLVQLVRGFKK